MGSYTLRVRILLIPFVAVAFIIIGKLYFLQIVHGEVYAARADRSALSPQAGIFNRGAIYFTESSGNTIAAATIKKGFTLSIKPTEVGDAGALYEKLSLIIPIEREEFIRKAGKVGDPHEEIARQLNKEQADRIRALKEKAIALESEQ